MTLKKHHESLALAKQVEENHKKLKQEHRELAHKYQELEFAYEAIDPSLENSINENIEKVNASTSCDDLLIDANATNVLPKLAPSREKELMDQVASLKSSVEKLSRGEYIHKQNTSTMPVTMEREVLVHFRSQTKALLLLRRSRQASLKKLDHIVNIAKSPGTTLGSVRCHHVLSLLYLKITHLCIKITIFF